jgi:uncharacterized membrane protein (UPF0127 family)
LHIIFSIAAAGYNEPMSAAFKLSLLVMGIVIGAGVASMSYLEHLTSLEGKVEVRIRNQIIVADTAADEASRGKGLSGRDALGVNEGLLFRFDTPDYQVFWMKDMKFPIDIVWIAGTRIAGFEENVPPPAPGVAEKDLALYTPPEPVDKVLELAAGRVRLLRAEPGDTVQIRPLIGEAAGGALFQPVLNFFRGIFAGS